MRSKNQTTLQAVAELTSKDMLSPAEFRRRFTPGDLSGGPGDDSDTGTGGGRLAPSDAEIQARRRLSRLLDAFGSLLAVQGGAAHAKHFQMLGLDYSQNAPPKVGEG